MGPPHDIARHAPTLLAWAEYILPRWLRGKLDPADLVQQTLLEALRSADKLAGQPDHKVLGYLRKALARNVIDEARKHARTRDDVSPDAWADSSVRLADWLADDHTSPTERADRNERFARLAEALGNLPDSQRLAVEMRYLLGMKVTEIAATLERSDGAVSLLLYRAVTALRDVLTEPDA